MCSLRLQSFIVCFFLFSSSSYVLSFWMIHHFSFNVYIRRRNDLRFHLKCWIPNRIFCCIHLSYCFRNRKFILNLRANSNVFSIFLSWKRWQNSEYKRFSTQCCDSILDICEIHFNYWIPKNTTKTFNANRLIYFYFFFISGEFPSFVPQISHWKQFVSGKFGMAKSLAQRKTNSNSTRNENCF